MGDWTRPFPPNKHLHFSPLRRTQTHKDSDGREYAIFVQNEEFSCALAATAIVIRLLDATAFANGSAEETKLKAISAKFPGSLRASDKLWAKEKIGEYGSKQFGTYADNVVKLLKSQGVKLNGRDNAVWDKVNGYYTSFVNPNTEKLKRPAMILWGWYNAGPLGERGGGHFTAVAGLTKAGKMIVLDPWDGTLTELDPAGVYKGSGYAEVVIYCGGTV